MKQLIMYLLKCYFYYYYIELKNFNISDIVNLTNFRIKNKNKTMNLKQAIILLIYLY